MTQDNGWEGSQHYRDLEVEPWEAMQSWLTQEEFVGFLKGCAIKRLARAHSKGEQLLDITKAIHELEKARDVLRLAITKEKKAKEKIHPLDAFLHNFTWADRQIRKGYKLKRRAWPPGQYICMGRNRASNYEYYRTNEGTPYSLQEEDKAATDWEILNGG